MGYLFLIITVLLESTAVIFMKLSHGFTHKTYGIVALAAYGISFITLTFALKYLQMGIANAIWAGASTIIVAIAGIFIFKEQLNGMQWFYLSLIIIGLIGLNYVKPLS